MLTRISANHRASALAVAVALLAAIAATDGVVATGGPSLGRPRPTSRSQDPASGSARPLRVAAVGDLLLAGSLLAKMEREGDDYPFQETAAALRGANLAFANLEVPLTRVNAFTAGKDPESVGAGRDYVFRAPPRLARAIRDAGFDVVSVANNHTMDHGAAGLAETMEALRSAGLRFVGGGVDDAEAARPVVTRIGDVAIAWMAASDILPRLSVADSTSAGIAATRGHHGGRDWRATLLASVRALKARGLIVVVSVHWGVEGASEPNGAQVAFARALAAAGADAILGHHPHVLQGFAWIDQTFVAYSLGNFVASPRGRLARESVILELRVDARGVVDARLRPTWIDDGQARLLAGADAEALMARIAAISARVGGAIGAGGVVEQPALGRPVRPSGFK